VGGSSERTKPVVNPPEKWRRLWKPTRPTLKELLLARAPRAEIPVPSRRGWRRRAATKHR